ncbi:helix-turn-helix domain-containing protein [Nocardioides sp. GY 10127]|uniref:helix-turn-helix transcriptional regulator n=1 Tax=Nocardioides sp. GY 10127 TaxID=2569762 RepID=UPI0010A939AA|nr:helix-turn-helix domain-containing protein [Nocardioides sp. GY 10127]TIC84105.1 helix-turn-helix domain-containing protein [Nocardioides sp. GY 10127]
MLQPKRWETDEVAITENLLTIKQVADATGIPERTWRHWRLNGLGPRSAKLGRRVVYRESDVRAWIDAQFEQAG